MRELENSCVKAVLKMCSECLQRLGLYSGLNFINLGQGIAWVQKWRFFHLLPLLFPITSLTIPSLFLRLFSPLSTALIKTTTEYKFTNYCLGV
ncbi:MAG TPA: hypothetical protein VLG37_03405 [Candidatus Saccharimonadales bacterium]|nr:hypothetical protein [Candidatus Saccharimonadales bacterium]